MVTALNVLPAFYDTGVLIAVAWRNYSTTRQIGTQIPILRRLLFDGIWYFVIITTTHMGKLRTSHLSLVSID